MKDWCTSFPEYWYTWENPTMWRKTYIGDCCKGHDSDCKTTTFFKCLRSKRIVGGIIITIGGALGCLFKYGKA